MNKTEINGDFRTTYHYCLQDFDLETKTIPDQFQTTVETLA